MKTTQVLLLSIIISLLCSCANTEDIAPESGYITYYFAPRENEITTFENQHGVTWNITRALMLPGEIGIHWDRSNSQSRSDLTSPIAPRHDVSGKISPKIYGYFAVNLLDTMKIQQLTVGTKHYDHIHMVMLPENAITTADTVKDIADAPELKTNSLFISGTVSKDGVTLPFEFLNSTVYGENDLGDILIDLSIYNGDHYSIYVHPDFSKWFDNIKWDHLTIGESVEISESSSPIAFMNVEGEFKSDNALTYTIEKH